MNYCRDTNRAAFSRDEVVTDYAKDMRLQIPEAIIFLKYKDYIWKKKILDLGCGAGRTAYVLKGISSVYFGVDYSAEMIECCRERFGPENFIQGDARDLRRFEDQMFDFILFSFNGIDYMNHQDRLACFSEIKRILKDEGVFVFSSHNRCFRNARRKPRFDLSLNPISTVKNSFLYLRRLKSYFGLKKSEITADEYAIWVDEAHDFSLLTYFIAKENQTSQLQSLSFDVIGIYDMQGKVLKPQDSDANAVWLYYVVQKKLK